MLRFLTAGESHGPLLTAILEGMPAGLPLSPDDIDGDLARRQQGYGSGGRMQIERDHARITGGVMGGRTTGGPISLTIENRDWKNWAQKDIEPLVTPRPGHADLTGALKYGYRDLRLALERSSARETAARVAVGAICKRLLGEFGVTVGGYVTAIGGENSEQGAARFEREVLCHRPDVLTIDYALNDRGLGLERARAAWVSMIEAALAAGVRLILCTPTADKTQLPGAMEEERRPLQEHAALVRSLAAEYEVGLADSLAAFERYLRAEGELSDLMSWINHPNRDGHQLVATELLRWLPM